MTKLGYKCFYKGLESKHWGKLELRHSYHFDSPVLQGEDERGFHFCERLEDALQHFSTWAFDVEIAEVIAIGKISRSSKAVFEYIASDIVISKVLSKDEVMNIAKKMEPVRFAKFITCYPLSDEDLYSFKSYFEVTSKKACISLEEKNKFETNASYVDAISKDANVKTEAYQKLKRTHESVRRFDRREDNK